MLKFSEIKIFCVVGWNMTLFFNIEALVIATQVDSVMWSNKCIIMADKSFEIRKFSSPDPCDEYWKSFSKPSFCIDIDHTCFSDCAFVHSLIKSY